MNIKTMVNVIKVVVVATTVIPPVVDGAKVVGKTVKNIVKDRIENSENIQEIKKRYKLRSEEGIITVDYKEV